MSFRNWITDYLPMNRGEVARHIGYAVKAELQPLLGRVQALEHAIASSEEPVNDHPHDHLHVSHAQLRDRLHHYVTKGDIDHRLHSIDAALARVEETNTKIYREVQHMSVTTDKLEADIATVAAGYGALQAENAALKAALASSDADKAQAVADAVAAEDVDAQSKIDAADAVVAGILPPASDSGGSTDGGSGDGGTSTGNPPDNPPSNPDDPTAPSN